MTEITQQSIQEQVNEYGPDPVRIYYGVAYYRVKEIFGNPERQMYIHRNIPYDGRTKEERRKAFNNAVAHLEKKKPRGAGRKPVDLSGKMEDYIKLGPSGLARQEKTSLRNVYEQLGYLNRGKTPIQRPQAKKRLDPITGVYGFYVEALDNVKAPEYTGPFSKFFHRF